MRRNYFCWFFSFARYFWSEESEIKCSAKKKNYNVFNFCHVISGRRAIKFPPNLMMKAMKWRCEKLGSLSTCVCVQSHRVTTRNKLDKPETNTFLLSFRFSWRRVCASRDVRAVFSPWPAQLNILCERFIVSWCRRTSERPCPLLLYFFIRRQRRRLHSSCIRWSERNRMLWLTVVWGSARSSSNGNCRAVSNANARAIECATKLL